MNLQPSQHVIDSVGSVGHSGILMSGHRLLALLTGSVFSQVHRSYVSLYPPLPQCTHEPMAASLSLETRAGQTKKVVDSGRSSSWEQLLNEAELSLISLLKRLRDASDLGRKLISLGCMGASEERREQKVLSISCSCLLAGLPLSHPRRVWILFFVQISVSVIGCEKCFFIT